MGTTSAAKDNLKKAQLARSIQFKKKKFAEFDRSLKHLADKIDLEVEKQVTKHLGKLDRKKLKDEFLQIFYDMGGRKAATKWAKENPSKYYSLMAAIVKAEAEKEGGGNKGIEVNFMFGDNKEAAIDITPDKEDQSLKIETK